MKGHWLLVAVVVLGTFSSDEQFVRPAHRHRIARTTNTNTKLYPFSVVLYSRRICNGMGWCYQINRPVVDTRSLCYSLPRRTIARSRATLCHEHPLPANLTILLAYFQFIDRILRFIHEKTKRRDTKCLRRHYVFYAGGGAELNKSYANSLRAKVRR